MAERTKPKPDRKPTQTTETGHEILIPKRDDRLADLNKIATGGDPPAKPLKRK